MEYSSLTDFDSKLSALKDPNCPGEIIDKIVNADDFPWGSEKAEMAKDLIASHSNTLPKQLENLFKNAANEHQKALILKNPNCPEKLKPTLDEIEIEEKKYTILSDIAAPERDISTHTFEEFIELCSFSKSLLNDWFEEYRYDAEVEQGEDYYHESIIQKIEYPDGSTNMIDIPVVLADTNAHSFDDAVEHELKTLKDGEILIQGEMEWTGGKWNSYSIELDESEKFEPNKIQAEGNLGMVVNYTYDGTSFKNNEDWNLTDGYINLSVYLKLDDEIHELDLDKLENSLEKNSLKIDSSNSDEILSHFKKYFKDKEDVENKAEEIVTDGPHKTFYEREGLEGILYEEGFLKNGQWDGLYKSYHSKGELQFEGNYKEGVRVGRWKRYSHTTPYIEKQGFKGGLYNDFRYKDKYEVDELKTLVDEGLEGLLHGPFIQYFYNRNIEFEGSYKNNKKDGLFKEYSFQGKLESEQNYKEGEVVD